jgi:uncharacterized membrane-anchored protein
MLAGLLLKPRFMVSIERFRGAFLMQIKNLPPINGRYWTAIVVASMAGANTGDFAARYLHLGHTRGLLPLALVFGAILWVENRAIRATEVYYWLAIIVLRTAATNLADLATHDLQLGYTLTEVLLAAFMVLLVGRDARRRPPVALIDSQPKLPATDMPYWVAMLTAGTLGTALGDFVADETGLGLGWGSLVLTAIVALVLLIAYRYGKMTTPWYWLSIVAARTAGTTLGDLLASRRGVNLGLPVSTMCTLAALALIVALWPRRQDGAFATAETPLKSS